MSVMVWWYDAVLVAFLESYPSVAVLADEIYKRLVYTSTGTCPSFASLPNMFNRGTLTANGSLKAYAMTGMRLGAPANLSKAVTMIQSQLASCASSISQAAGVVALIQVTEEEMRNNVKIMGEKRDFVLKQLGTMPGVRLPAIPPSGAFYILPDMSSYYGGDDAALRLDLLKKNNLALVPGSNQALALPE